VIKKINIFGRKLAINIQDFTLDLSEVTYVMIITESESEL